MGSIVALPHGTVYGIELVNRFSTDCDFWVQVDGGSIDQFQLAAHSTGRIFRPVSKDAAFTFVAENSAAAKQAGMKEGKDSNGSIVVYFVPELPREEDEPKESELENRILSDREQDVSLDEIEHHITTAKQHVEVASSQETKNESKDKRARGATILGEATLQTFQCGTSIPLHRRDRRAAGVIRIQLVLSTDDHPADSGSGWSFCWLSSFC